MYWLWFSVLILCTYYLLFYVCLFLSFLLSKYKHLDTHQLLIYVFVVRKYKHLDTHQLLISTAWGTNGSIWQCLGNCRQSLI